MNNTKNNYYKGILKQTKNNSPYTFNDLLEEIKGNNLSKLTHPNNNTTPKKIIKKYIEKECEKINETDEFL